MTLVPQLCGCLFDKSLVDVDQRNPGASLNQWKSR